MNKKTKKDNIEIGTEVRLRRGLKYGDHLVRIIPGEPVQVGPKYEYPAPGMSSRVEFRLVPLYNQIILELETIREYIDYNQSCETIHIRSGHSGNVLIKVEKILKEL